MLRVGDLPTSKPLRQWLHGLDDAVQVAFDPENAWQDPAGAVATIVRADPRATLTAARRADQRVAATARGWRAGAARPRRRQRDRRRRSTALSEPRVAAELTRRLPPNATLVVASSMPVRDVETFAPARDDGPRVLANRGANGIDGTVSTAFGAAAAAPHGPVVLLTGDVALAHDVGGLLAARRLGIKLTIVLLDNDGGGIFDFLPVSGEGARLRAARRHPARARLRARRRRCTAAGSSAPRTSPASAGALDRALASDRTTIVR